MVGLLPPVFFGSAWQLADPRLLRPLILTLCACSVLGVRFLTSDKWFPAVGSPFVIALLSRFSHPLASIHEVGRVCGGANLRWFNVCAFYVPVQ